MSPDMSRVNAFMSKCHVREKLEKSGIEPEKVTPAQPAQIPLDVSHGLSFDKSKRRYIARFTLDRGGQVVGKRIAIRVLTTDFNIAVMVRDAVLDFCFAIGLKVNRRPQRRPNREGGES